MSHAAVHRGVPEYTVFRYCQGTLGGKPQNFFRVTDLYNEGEALVCYRANEDRFKSGEWVMFSLSAVKFKTEISIVTGE